jgi:hypothetical protein
MPSLIESLVEGPIARTDQKRLSVTVRPPPMRLRDVLEVFAAMGRTASFQGAHRSLELRAADPVILANAVLGRWLSLDELAEYDGDKNRWPQLKAMLLSQEFRTPFVRRVLDAFSEKRRVMHVRIPSCAGRHVLELMDGAGPLIPLDVGTKRYANPDSLGPLFGRLFGNINTARGISVSLPALSPFVDPPGVSVAGADPLHWVCESPPYRATDLLFTLLRPPVALALSQVNGSLTALRDQQETPALARIRAQFGPLPRASDASAWKALARTLLSDFLPANPICTALGDGTAAGAIAACGRVPIELVSLENDRYKDWARPAINAQVHDPIGVSEPFLTQPELTPQDHLAISSRMGEDIVFFDRFAKLLEKSGLPFVRGPDLLREDGEDS